MEISSENFETAEKAKVVLYLLAIALLGRAIFYLLSGEPFAFFSLSQKQQILEQTVGWEVGMGLMTILWPIGFAALNRMHEGLRLAWKVFYAVLATHTLSCLIALFMLIGVDNSTLTIRAEHAEGFGDLEDLPKVETILVIFTLTLIFVLCAVGIYRGSIQAQSKDA